MIDLNIDAHNSVSIVKSFNRIANDLILNWSLKVNRDIYSFTEIEFYYYDENHKDVATHEHDYDAGLWRFHLQGIDITFKSTATSDGGILIRGLKKENYFDKEASYINGPKRVLETIFKSLGSVNSLNKELGLVSNQLLEKLNIYKTIRHGLSEKQNNPFHNAMYRYYVDIDNWSSKHVSETEKSRIKKNSTLNDN